MLGEWVHKHRQGNGNTPNLERGSKDLSDENWERVGLRARGLRPSYPSASKQASKQESKQERESDRERERERVRETERLRDA